MAKDKPVLRTPHESSVIEFLEKILERQGNLEKRLDEIERDQDQVLALVRHDSEISREALHVARDVKSDQEKQDRLLGEILDALEPSVEDFTLSQIQGDTEMAINGTVVGTTSTFQIGFVPATNFIPLQAGPAVAVDDTNVTLTQPDPKTLQFTAAVAAGDTAASYNLTVTGTNDQGVALTHTFNIPILPTPPPPPTSITDFSLDQNS
jgi:hypothetical protein